MTRIPKIAVFLLGISILLIILGCCLAFSYQDNDNTGDNKENIENNHSWKDKNSLDNIDLYEVILPEGTPSQIKEYTGFKLSFNKENRTPNYVSWELLGSEVNGNESRNNNFHQDPEIEGCPDQYAYKNSGYDRGHLCPAADQKWSFQAMNDCFVMANMCPQAPELNQRAWQTLEDKERQWARRDSALWIVAGPIYQDSDTERIGSYKVRVPSAFFKVFLAKDIPSPRAIAFVYPNALSPGNMQNYAMSVYELEEITGYDFFSALDDEIEEMVEAKYSFKEWNK